MIKNQTRLSTKQASQIFTLSGCIDKLFPALSLALILSAILLFLPIIVFQTEYDQKLFPVANAQEQGVKVRFGVTSTANINTPTGTVVTEGVTIYMFMRLVTGTNSNQDIQAGHDITVTVKVNKPYEGDYLPDLDGYEFVIKQGNSRSASVEVKILDDGIPEGKETLFFFVKAVSDNNVEKGLGWSVSIADPDGVPPPKPEISCNNPAFEFGMVVSARCVITNVGQSQTNIIELNGNYINEHLTVGQSLIVTPTFVYTEAGVYWETVAVTFDEKYSATTELYVVSLPWNQTPNPIPVLNCEPSYREISNSIIPINATVDCNLENIGADAIQAKVGQTNFGSLAGGTSITFTYPLIYSQPGFYVEEITATLDGIPANDIIATNVTIPFSWQMSCNDVVGVISGTLSCQITNTGSLPASHWIVRIGDVLYLVDRPLAPGQSDSWQLEMETIGSYSLTAGGFLEWDIDHAVTQAVNINITLPTSTPTATSTPDSTSTPVVPPTSTPAPTSTPNTTPESTSTPTPTPKAKIQLLLQPEKPITVNLGQMITFTYEAKNIGEVVVSDTILLDDLNGEIFVGETITPGLSVITTTEYTVTIGDVIAAGSRWIENPAMLQGNSTSGRVVTDAISFIEVDPGVVILGSNILTVNESVNTVELILACPGCMTSPYPGQVSIAYTGTLSLNEYSAPQHVMFQPGQLLNSLTISITNDPLYEYSEQLGLVLTKPIGLGLGNAVTATIIVSDDDQMPWVGFVLPTYHHIITAYEFQELITVVVGLDMMSGVPTTATLAFTGESQIGQDLSIMPAEGGTKMDSTTSYVRYSDLIDIPPGTLTKVFTITIIDDDIFEDRGNCLIPCEQSFLSITDSINARPITLPLKLQIIDDDYLLRGKILTSLSDTTILSGTTAVFTGMVEPVFVRPSYSWRFEGQASTLGSEQYFTHTFSAPGTYTLTMIATKSGRVVSDQLVITVEDSSPLLPSIAGIIMNVTHETTATLKMNNQSPLTVTLINTGNLSITYWTLTATDQFGEILTSTSGQTITSQNTEIVELVIKPSEIHSPTLSGQIEFVGQTGLGIITNTKIFTIQLVMETVVSTTTEIIETIAPISATIQVSENRFLATVSPISVTTPLTYIWTTGISSVVHASHHVTDEFYLPNVPANVVTVLTVTVKNISGTAVSITHPIIPQVTLVGPLSGTVTSTNNPLFTWLSITGTFYRVVMTKSETNQMTVFTVPAERQQAERIVSNDWLLEEGYSYLWTVSACIDEQTCGPEHAPWMLVISKEDTTNKTYLPIIN
jgi:hypothetical protein